MSDSKSSTSLISASTQATKSNFSNYAPIYQLGKDQTPYRKLEAKNGSSYVSTQSWNGREVLMIDPEGLAHLMSEAFSDVSHLLRPKHLEMLSKILQDPEASSNDRFVALDLLRNAVIAAEGEFPSCQDTGTAIVMGKKGEQVFTGVDDKEFISKGIVKTFTEKNLRYSQVAPLSFFDEKNTGTNLPAQIDLYTQPGNEYHFLCVAKGGGSANKSYLYQKTKAVLNPTAFEKFVKEALGSLGTAACPPYHLALVVGGTSAEETMKIVKQASCGYLDQLPTTGDISGRAFRDLEMEKQVEKWARETGIGAQFGGKYFVHDVRVIRLPRHGASCPIGIGVSCSADRNIKAKITKEGIFLEQLEAHPARFLPTSFPTPITNNTSVSSNSAGLTSPSKSSGYSNQSTSFGSATTLSASNSLSSKATPSSATSSNSMATVGTSTSSSSTSTASILPPSSSPSSITLTSSDQLSNQTNSIGSSSCSGSILETTNTPPNSLSNQNQSTDQSSDEATVIDLNKPITENLKILSTLKVSTRVMLNGPMIVARDIAHAKLKELLDQGNGVPEYFKKFAVYYAGPAKTPKGYASGSFGPTTSERMDPYVGDFQNIGASMIMLGKGNRNPSVTEACKKYGGFYLGSIGGPAARLGKECITKVEVLDFAELGMEAVWKIEVKDFPAFIIIDNKGNDFFKSIIKTK
jgi:tartrate/fumarate subfamily iron-sulfur-dependent hydro-lyase beta chain/tartrate/fumarate subfamily iron-sulfur-dependent hydro-lyase alpha chain